LQLGSESGDTASMTARDALEEIAIKFPTFPDVQAALAGIYYAEGRVTASRVAWEVALEVCCSLLYLVCSLLCYASLPCLTGRLFLALLSLEPTQ
jgi:hypothetical protein